MKYLKTILLLSILSLSCPGCAIYHHYGPYYGKVVDAETKQPLEGAVVLADYNTWLWASPGGEVGYFLDAQEVVSDKNGEFRIPSLNAFAFRPLSTFNHEPYFTVFRPRYGCYATRLSEGQYLAIVLRELKTREERLKNYCGPTSVPDYKMARFNELKDVERMELGLKPIFIKDKKK